MESPYLPFPAVCRGCNLVFIAALLGAAPGFNVEAWGQIRSFSGYDANVLPATDDNSSDAAALGFTVDLFGATYSDVFVNNNGNITFDQPLYAFTPNALSEVHRTILAPFFADVDTRTEGANPVTYGSGWLEGHRAFAANYLNVSPYFQLQVFDSFQVVLVDRSDIGLGDFDFEFNFSAINWEAGSASGGDEQGRGGQSARAGYASADGLTAFELPGSGVNGVLLDDAPTGLIHHGSGQPFDGESALGRYVFAVRDGEIAPAMSSVPEPAAYSLFAAGLLLAVSWRRRRA